MKLTDGLCRMKGRQGGAYRDDKAIVGLNCITDRTVGMGFAQCTGNTLALGVELAVGSNTWTY